MSNCRAPTCSNYNFSECQNRVFPTTPGTEKACDFVGATGQEEREASCVDNVSGQTFNVSDSDCNHTTEVDCTNHFGCYWGDKPSETNLFQKGCLSRNVFEADIINYKCSSQSSGDETPDFQAGKGRYSSLEKEHYGCPKSSCTYTPQKKEREYGICVNKDGQVCSANNSRNKEICINDTNKNSCIWVANDDQHCGYDRKIEETLEKISGIDYEKTKSQIEDIDFTGDIFDPCFKIKNPGLESCREAGCVWDIYGNREEVFVPTKQIDLDGLEEEMKAIVYYDVNTSGLCKLPGSDNCMNHFCSRNSKTDTDNSGTMSGDINYQVLDGKCMGTPSSNTCSPRGEEIEINKTPGLIDFLSSDSPQNIRDNHISAGRGSGDPQARNLNKLIEFAHLKNTEKSVTSLEKANLLKKDVQNIYKEHCENHREYPTGSITSSSSYNSDWDNKGGSQYNYYDINTDQCFINELAVTTTGSHDNLGERCSSLINDVDKTSGDNFYYHNWPGSDNTIANRYTYVGNTAKCVGNSGTDNDGKLLPQVSGSCAVVDNADNTFNPTHRCKVDYPQDISNASSQDVTIKYDDYNNYYIKRLQNSVNYKPLGRIKDDSFISTDPHDSHLYIDTTNQAFGTGVDLTETYTYNVSYDKMKEHIECRRNYYEIVEKIKNYLNEWTANGLTDNISIFSKIEDSITIKFPITLYAFNRLIDHIRSSLTGETTLDEVIKTSLQGFFGTYDGSTTINETHSSNLFIQNTVDLVDRSAGQGGEHIQDCVGLGGTDDFCSDSTSAIPDQGSTWTFDANVGCPVEYHYTDPTLVLTDDSGTNPCIGFGDSAECDGRLQGDGYCIWNGTNQCNYYTGEMAQCSDTTGQGQGWIEESYVYNSDGSATVNTYTSVRYSHKKMIFEQILKFVKELQLGIITTDSCLSQIANYLASFVVYSYNGDANNCVFNPMLQTYQDLGSTVDDASARGILEKGFLDHHYQTKIPFTMDGNSNNIYEYIGKNESSKLVQNISNTLRIKEIIPNKGNALIVLKPDEDTSPDITFSGNITFPLVDSGSIQPEDKLFNETLPHTVISSKKYLNGIVELEIDNVEPGCYGNNINPDNTCNYNGVVINTINDIKLGELYNILLDSSPISDYILHEVRFKDITSDVYFEGSINGLYEEGDIITINGPDTTDTLNNYFNQNFTITVYDSSLTIPDDVEERYNQITDIDLEKNKITINNVKRHGKYFLGNNDLSKAFMSPKKCLKVDAGKSFTILTEEKCDLDKKLYEQCYSLDPTTCESDGMCHYINDVTNDYFKSNNDPIDLQIITDRCVPKDIFDFDGSNGYKLKTTDNTNPLGIITISGQTDKFKCNELDNTISSPLVKTMCPSDFSDTDPTVTKHILYETMFTETAGSSSSSIGPASGGIYDISSFLENIKTNYSNLTSINFYSGMLDDWNITYIVDTNTIDNVEINEGKISEHTYVDGTTQTIKISNLTTEPIHILNIKPPNIHSKDNKYKIKSFIKNPPAESTMPLSGDIIDNITDKNKCNINNGQWESYDCRANEVDISTVQDKRLRNIDLCENTGYNYDQSKNICLKKVDSTTNAILCLNKTKKDKDNSQWDPNAQLTNHRPCDACSWHEDLQSTGNKYCKGKDRYDCVSTTEETTCNDKAGCEWYIDSMDAYPRDTADGTVDPFEPFQFFTCDNISGGDGITDAVCNVEANDTKDRCEEDGCEWKCPFLGDLDPSYVATAGDSPIDSTSNKTIDTQTDKYLSPQDITLSCAEGYTTPLGITSPIAQCLSIESNDTQYGMGHSHKIVFSGCLRELKCKNDDYTAESIREIVSSNANGIDMIPQEFVIGEGTAASPKILDESKLPNNSGEFNCPNPQTLRIDAETTSAGGENWSSSNCCENVGLCTDNRGGIGNVTCPVGQVIKMRTYEGNDDLRPAIGSTVDVCCEQPQEPTVTLTVDGDYEQFAGDELLMENTILSFSSDIAGILTAAEEIETVVTSDMIEVLEIIDVGSGGTVERFENQSDLIEGFNSSGFAIVFRVKKDANNNVVLSDQITRTLTAGKSLGSLGVTINSSPTFKQWDPDAKYVKFLVDNFDIRLTSANLLGGTVGTFFVSFLCLVVLGLLFK